MNTRTLIVLAGLALTLATPAAADLSSWMQITGAGQGLFPGDGVGAHQDEIEVLEYHHLMERLAGQSTEHQEIILTLDFGEQSMPYALVAFNIDESLAVTINFYRPDPGGGGAELNYVRIQLTNAKIVSIEPLSPRSDDPALMNFRATARVRLSYSSIQHLHVPTGLGVLLNN